MPSLFEHSPKSTRPAAAPKPRHRRMHRSSRNAPHPYKPRPLVLAPGDSSDSSASSADDTDFSMAPPSLPRPPLSPRRAAMRASKDAKSCPTLPLDESSSDEASAQPPMAQPRPFRRGSLPAAKRDLPLLNFGNLRSPCAVLDDLRTPRRRVEAIGTSLSRFRPYLYVCGDAAARDLPALRRAGVTHVVNLAGHAAPNYHQGQLKYLHLYLRDDALEDIRPALDAVAAFVDAARAEGGAAAVHCRQGISRSVTAALAYVLMREGASLDAAMREMRACRPIAHPNAGFFDALCELDAAVRGGQRRPRLLVVRRHAADAADETTPFLATPVQRVGRRGSLDEREAYVLQRTARHGIVAWRGAKVGESVWQRTVSCAKRLGEQELRDAERFPLGGKAQRVVLVRQGESTALDCELARVLRL